jgi:hypothetical protein
MACTAGGYARATRLQIDLLNPPPGPWDGRLADHSHSLDAAVPNLANNLGDEGNLVEGRGQYPPLEGKHPFRRDQPFVEAAGNPGKGSQ